MVFTRLWKDVEPSKVGSHAAAHSTGMVRRKVIHSSFSIIVTLHPAPLHIRTRRVAHAVCAPAHSHEPLPCTRVSTLSSRAYRQNFLCMGMGPPPLFCSACRGKIKAGARTWWPFTYAEVGVSRYACFKPIIKFNNLAYSLWAKIFLQMWLRRKCQFVHLRYQRNQKCQLLQKFSSYRFCVSKKKQNS